MTDLETCREHILSEEYRDFIGNNTRSRPFFDSIMKDDLCVQDAGFDYKCFYFPKETVEPVTLSKFSYNSIPKCFAPLSMETLNQTGILPIQNYPTLQLKGEGVLIGFWTAGLIMKTQYSAVLTAPLGSPRSGTRPCRREHPGRVFLRK